MKKYIPFIVTLTILLAVIAGSLYYFWPAPKPVGGPSVPAVVAPAVKKAPVVKRIIKEPVKVYAGESKANLKLPASMIADDRQQVIAASQVRAELRPQTVSTVVNTETGAVESFVKQDPYPWLAVEARGEVKLAYGYKHNANTGASGPVVRLQVGYDVVRIKALTVGVLATVDSDRDAFAGVALTYRW